MVYITKRFETFSIGIFYAVKRLHGITFNAKLHSNISEMHELMKQSIPPQTPVLLYKSGVQRGLNYIGLLTWCIIWTASSEFGTYRLCEQRRFRRACASAQSRQNLRCSPIQAVNQEEPSDRKPDPWSFWMAGHAQLKFVMTECSKTQIPLMGLILMVCTEILFCCI